MCLCLSACTCMREHVFISGDIVLFAEGMMKRSSRVRVAERAKESVCERVCVLCV